VKEENVVSWGKGRREEKVGYWGVYKRRPAGVCKLRGFLLFGRGKLKSLAPLVYVVGGEKWDN
jgi:hypothetical protein